MADEYVVASPPGPCRPASGVAVPGARAGSARPRQPATPAQASSFAIEVLQSIAAPATRRRQTIVALRGAPSSPPIQARAPQRKPAHYRGAGATRARSAVTTAPYCPARPAFPASASQDTP
jgi:hypothetical protein